ncbi:2-amino-4-hydroxy-6-hydroxymethyldihydropteridine diphosphokinase [Vibrio sp. UCD-FRSSP16_10]|uniref:2-amino-4-hydroxy-6- hydroxymethyldihydropteridine diphosphokinase n=1 Tax=unclassified Vibrio TaxID=2614977 RepID=UPI0007FCE75C|nr:MULTISPECIES: 2-amino-4-hydroxy-6-hydroxymethyldihydropteridine diphosphokinase [unclassified Vibrio]OBT07379.1 2-amino-4-hydroxy-6-hydroxymethyldihydropteridine diphosphokinase [Vibrio sp. UCD-FRSSP16_30]OBT12858.1 2-amino-4-hydroxy-6-hydroxymethyldihydropteridine diphosphokinase [Vibrio sp. UCD-FRSSP16_10]
MTQAYLGIGTNIDRDKYAKVAIIELQRFGRNLQVSTIYRCPASGFNGAEFYNFVIGLDTDLALADFSHQLRALELACGRPEDAKKQQDRTLDIDILLFGDVLSQHSPQLPRSDIVKFNFVLQPLYELCPELIVPGDGRSIEQIWQQQFLSMGGMSNLTATSLPLSDDY